MSRAERLLSLMQALRAMRPPVRATRLAEALGVTPRTIYRDIGALRASGARIEGAAGYGYTLTEDPALPPQSFDRMELEAVLLGLAEVQALGDASLAHAAEQAAAKLVARLPDRQRREAAATGLMVRRWSRPPAAEGDLRPVLAAIWDERALDLAYADREGRETERQVLPLQVVHLDHALMLLAWCCLREEFRMFRLDRCRRIEPAARTFRPRRVALLRDYLALLQSRGGQTTKE
ncbi:helix-turn-helix transcriptional regulator [Wenxinia saemankumensis]|uniref:HTH domain-containing protein n=1 Tax=Wenxinia saemankumensis TaxID=1447782 RepID=A0A1M6FPF2_9RHOB|nr:YafY family protein [Wenxinia saemankumensis]SHI99546.1 HTH domain-containing protein [Wenxinia saemankumensis]